MNATKKAVGDFQSMKQTGQKIAWLTAYDFPTASFEEAAGVDMILVGDSLGMCVYGYPDTVPVTVDQCLAHTEAVRRGAPNTFVIGDMPFMSYQAGDADAVRNAGRFLKEASADAIKLEGGVRVSLASRRSLTPESSSADTSASHRRVRDSSAGTRPRVARSNPPSW